MSSPIITFTTAPSNRIGKAFAVINQMVVDGVIEKYAVGGATAAFFYIEPDTTFDVDIFCDLQVLEGSGLATIMPIYEYLRDKGYSPDAEAVNIEGIAVQFLPVSNPLNDEAVQQARTFDFQGISVNVMSPEHLVAIMLQTGRPKDLVRVARFLEADAFDTHVLRKMLDRHGLAKEWNALRSVQRRLKPNEKIS